MSAIRLAVCVALVLALPVYGAIVYQHSGAAPVAIDDVSAVRPQQQRGWSSATLGTPASITITPTWSGYPPGAKAGQFLRADGTWTTPSNTAEPTQ